MPAHPDEVREAREEGVVFQFLSAPENVVLDGQGEVCKLVCCQMDLGEADADGRARPVRREGSEFDLDTDSVLTAIGEGPDLSYFTGRVDADHGAIPVDGRGRAGEKKPGRAGIYAGGDIIDQPHTVVHAVASGKRAVLAMDCERGRGEDWDETVARIGIGDGGALSFSAYMGWDRDYPVALSRRKVVRTENIVYDYFQKVSAVRVTAQAPQQRIRSFEPFHQTFTEDQAQAEAVRCFHCGRCIECDNCLIFCPEISVLLSERAGGRYQVDYDYCKGCGICAVECPRQAITMVEEEATVEAEKED